MAINKGTYSVIIVLPMHFQSVLSNYIVRHFIEARKSGMPRVNPYYSYLMIICNSYNTGKSALPDIYAQRLRVCSAQGRVRIYQAKYECLCYK